jgi:hypothetical protein
MKRDLVHLGRAGAALGEAPGSTRGKKVDGIELPREVDRHLRTARPARRRLEEHRAVTSEAERYGRSRRRVQQPPGAHAMMVSAMESDRRVTVVRRGTYLNQDKVACEVRVVRLELRPDEPSTAMYCIEWGSPDERGKFSSGLFGFTSAADAAAHVEKSASAVRWLD